MEKIITAALERGGCVSVKDSNILYRAGIKTSFLKKLATDSWAAKQRPALLNKIQELEDERFRLQQELAESHKIIRQTKKLALRRQQREWKAFLAAVGLAGTQEMPA